jgi:hypothetical protein
MASAAFPPLQRRSRHVGYVLNEDETLTPSPHLPFPPVQLTEVHAELAEERWLQSELQEAQRLHLEAQAERDAARRKAEQRISFIDSLAFHVHSLSSLFAVSKKPTPDSSSRTSGPTPLPLSLHSKPPSQRSRAPVSHVSAYVPTDPLDDSVPSQRFVDHLVVPEDDLVDLALRYDTEVQLIRRHNRRVVFQHLDNVVGEVLRIPVKPSFQLPTPVPTQAEGEARQEPYVPQSVQV